MVRSAFAPYTKHSILYFLLVSEGNIFILENSYLNYLSARKVQEWEGGDRLFPLCLGVSPTPFLITVNC